MAGTLSAMVLRVLLHAVRRAGGDPDRVLADIGLSPEGLDQPERRIPTALAFRAFERALELVEDEAFCLHVVGDIPVGAFDVLDFAVRSAATMGDALERMARYYRFIDDQSSLHLEVDGELASLVGRRTGTATPRPATELLFAIVVARGRLLTGQSWPMREVSFQAEAPRDSRAHEAFFAAPVRFAQAHNALRFDASWLRVPCRTADPVIDPFLERQAGILLQAVPRDYLDQVRDAIARAMNGSAPTLAKAARQLGTGARTLQRRLREHGTGFQQELARVRLDTARTLLADGRLTVAEIAYLLGFSDPSAFHHAFARWTGSAPSDYRAARAAGDRSAAAPPGSKGGQRDD